MKKSKNSEFDSLIKESLNKRYTSQDTRDRIKKLEELVETDPSNAEAYRIILRMNNKILKWKNEV